MIGVDPRHSRNALFPGIGAAGQQRLYESRVTIIGCGALGSHAAELLARAGVGRGDRGLLRIVDRDYVDVSNLQRQALFDTEDARTSRPKAVAAARHIAAIDPEVHCEAIVRDFNAGNFERLLERTDVVIDATDNFRTRFLLNDAAITLGLPWVYAGAVADRGIVGFIHPGKTPCLRCFLESVPAFGSAESCETAGIITPLPAIVAAIEVTTAMRYLIDGEAPAGLLTIDGWKGGGETSRSLQGARPLPDCPSCGLLELPALTSETEQTVTLCGRNSVQIYSSLNAELSRTAEALRRISDDVSLHAESVTARLPQGSITLFEDGRVIVEGTTDPLEARSLVARYLGG
jgi:molybdopterin/thiamine biosynthesis adenylyltransferase